MALVSLLTAVAPTLIENVFSMCDSDDENSVSGWTKYAGDQDTLMAEMEKRDVVLTSSLDGALKVYLHDGSPVAITVTLGDQTGTWLAKPKK